MGLLSFWSTFPTRPLDCLHAEFICRHHLLSVRRAIDTCQNALTWGSSCSHRTTVAERLAAEIEGAFRRQLLRRGGLCPLPVLQRRFLRVKRWRLCACALLFCSRYSRLTLGRRDIHVARRSWSAICINAIRSISRPGLLRPDVASVAPFGFDYSGFFGAGAAHMCPGLTFGFSGDDDCFWIPLSAVIRVELAPRAAYSTIAGVTLAATAAVGSRVAPARVRAASTSPVVSAIVALSLIAACPRRCQWILASWL